MISKLLAIAALVGLTACVAEPVAVQTGSGYPYGYYQYPYAYGYPYGVYGGGPFLNFGLGGFHGHGFRGYGFHHGFHHGFHRYH